MKQLLILISILGFTTSLIAQEGSVSGTITFDGAPLESTSVTLLGTSKGTLSDEAGNYHLQGIQAGTYRIVFSQIGYRTSEKSITVEAGKILVLDLTMVEDLIGLNEVVVSATRNEIPIHKAPVVVHVIDNRLFNNTQSLSLSEGLNFTPGLRLETNCQNCGFTQVRMNGLDGAYSQILINSRPVFSALAGVYGLEQIPANMIERVEVIRGAGSVLYGGNAIAGTVNIITKDPIINSFEFSSNLGFVDYRVPDQSYSVNGSIVSEDLKAGMNLYALNRKRGYFDANDDGYSELTKMNNTTFGADAFYKFSDRKRLGFNIYNINEFRRGGNGFDLAPHFSDITEQLDHKILGAGLTYEYKSPDMSHSMSFYASAQRTDRASYYGGGGAEAYKHIIDNNLFVTGAQNEDDFAALEAFDIAQNAYGEASDLSTVAGVQYRKEFNHHWNLALGAEYQSSATKDNIPGYERLISQRVGVLGSFAQLTYHPVEPLTVLVGARLDNVNINGNYELGTDKFNNEVSLFVPVPRISVLYNLSEDLRFRAGYAQGYRAPQAFDEDLHIETVGGAARFTVLTDELKVERSDSYTLSADYTTFFGRWQTSFIVEGFYTNLFNPFINANPVELPSGVTVLTKRNGDGAVVSGGNLEARIAASRKLNFQLGMTWQQAIYKSPETIWEPDEETLSERPDLTAVSTSRILKTPNLYGFWAMTWIPVPDLSLSFSGVYTGSMQMPHVTGPVLFPDEPSSTLITYTELTNTRQFLECNIKLSYDTEVARRTTLQVFGGIQNIFNSYQKDFDRGAIRDSDYVYGPGRPQTLFVGVKFSSN